ncbi:MAG: ankyrin repeat domain-containing protein [Bacteroidota bacterium]
MKVNRKQFLGTALASSAGLLLPTAFIQAKNQDGPPRLKNEIVQEFVGIAHRDINRVKEMHAEHPTLLNAAWDWGGGDFETALGAASHVGNKEIIYYLLGKGAQMNFLTACVLGEMDMVKAMVSYNANLIHMKGPHGFTALHHAIVGGEEAKDVKKYLELFGMKEKKIKLY